jgi:hypothetical protein
LLANRITIISVSEGGSMAKEATQPTQKEVPESQQNDEGRGRSRIAFPYLGLEEAVQIAKAVHTLGGPACQWDQLAAHFKQAANGGGFRLRLLTAKMFGLVNYDRGTVTLTSLGSRVADPDQEKAARTESFLAVPLYRAIYEQFKGGTLPPTSGLETAMVNLGVAPKQKGKARQVFQRSAKEAGFFDFGATRLVMPAIKSSSGKPEAQDEEETSDTEEKEKREKPTKRHHALIEGLIRILPETETQWDLQGRRKWLLAASNIFDLIYTDSDENKGSLKIEVEKPSAK